MFGHSTVVSGLAARENLVLTAGYDRRVILWDDASRQILGVGYHDHLANQARFSPDGQLALSTGSDFTARLWSIPRMQLTAVLRGHTDDIECAEFHPTRRLIATASFDDTIGLFDFEGQMVGRLEGHESDVNTVFWKDEETLISTGDDGTIRVWSLAERRQIAFINVSDVETDTICNGPGRITFCGNDAGEIISLDGDKVVGRFVAHEAGIKRLVFEPEAAQLVSSSYDGYVKFWNVHSDGSCLLAGAFEFPQIVWPRSCAYMGNGRYAFATFGSTYATFDLKSKQWDATFVNPSESLNVVTEHGGKLYAIGDAGRLLNGERKIVTEMGKLCNALRPCGASLLTGGQSGQVWDAITGSELHRHPAPINGGGDTLVSQGQVTTILGTYTGDILIFNAPSDGPARFVATKRIADNSVKDVALTQDLSLAVIATGRGVIFDTNTLEVVREVDAHDEVANACTTTPNGFASVGRDLYLVLWDRVGNVLSRIRSPHYHSIKTLCRAGNLLILGDYRGFVSSYDIATGVFSPLRRICETGISSVFASTHSGPTASTYDGRLLRFDITSQNTTQRASDLQLS